MRRFLVKVEYNGKDYSGFQKNSNGRTIQAEIESAIEKVFGVKVPIVGVSRTDAGVSAVDYYFHFDVDTTLPTQRVSYKLNRFLPKDIQCQQSLEVSNTFDARKNVVDKTYEYTLYTSPHIRPVVNRFALRVDTGIDIDKMREISKECVGTHDFRAFCSSGADVKSTIRTIKRIDIIPYGDMIRIYVTGDGFLYNMVRILVGTLIECGLGNMTREQVAQAISQGERKYMGKTLPAKALVLYKVNYGQILNNSIIKR